MNNELIGVLENASLEVNVTITEAGPKGDKGDDGYTPIKGVDYFDGDKGDKGDDGYTPIKGVDYFDGEQGPKGDDGLTTAVKVGSTQYNHTGGVVSLPAYPTALPADGGDADTVNGKTVSTNVPADAKFTDTVYSHPPTHPASMITDLPTGKKVARFVVGTSTTGWTAADCDYLCDGTDDQVEINNAITALPATGGEIVILDGTYSITATIDVTKDNVSIRGNGNATILKRMFDSSVVEGVITLTSRSGCKIANLQIDGNSASFANIGNSGIYLGVSSNNTVTGNTCNNNSYGIYLISSSNNTFTGNTCNNNNYGIYLVYSSNNNTVTGNTCTRGTGLPTDYTASQYTIWLSGIGNNYNLISNNNCMGKAPVVNGGTGNSVYGNKYDSGDYKDFTQDEKTKLAGISDEANKYTHPDSHPASMIIGLPNSLPADGGNADTVGGFTVGTNVPSGAKFTDTITTINDKTGAIGKADIVALGIPSQDTVYSHPSNHPASMITESTTKRFVSDTEKATWNSKETTTGSQAKADAAEQNAKDYTDQEISSIDIPDSTWESIQNKPDTFAPSEHNHTIGNITGLQNELNSKETPSGSQSKANVAESNAKDYVDGKVKTDVPIGAKFTDTIVDISGKADKSYVDSELAVKVDNSRVLTDVPVGAKFTDTVYTHPATHSADMITGLPTSLPASGGNADTVGGFTVGVSVPANAKFTDTVYTHPATHSADMITGLPTSLPASGGNADTVGGFTVGVSVPANAKFTDTVYTHPATHSADMITGLPTSLPASGGNADTVGGFTVGVSVPANAKFTDTVYSHPTTHPASMITDLPTGKRVARFVVGTSTAGWTAADCDYLCDGTADQTEINAAITALPATGGEIVILDGTYNITATIDVTKDNVSIRGNGNATILKRMFNSTSPPGVIALTGSSGCNIANLQVDGNSASFGNTGNSGISLNASSNNTIIGNTYNNNGYGIRITDSSNNTITGNTCSNNNSGIVLLDSSNNTVTGNTCTRGTGLPTDYTASQYTIRLAGTVNNYNLISNNNCMGKAPRVDGGTGNSVYGNKYDSGDYKDFTQDEKTKLAGISDEANKYTHPDSHPASMIIGLPTSLPADGGNADTVGGFTVGTNVPADAKFTDTVYSHPSSHPASMITGLPTSLPADGGNADTVNGKTVGTNVPAGAKFTDTVYSHPSSHPASMITESSTKRFVSDSEKSTWNSKSDTDTVTTINGKTGAISKADIVALGIPAQDTVVDINGKADKTYVDSKVKTDVPEGAKFTDTVYTHPPTHPASMITESSTKRFVSDSEKSTWNSKSDIDTVTTINGKTGAISKADIVALGIPASDTNTTYSEITTAEIDTGTDSTLRTITGRRVKYILDKVQGWIGGLTKSDVGLSNVDNVKQMPISGGVLENYREKLVTLSGTDTAINLSLGNVFTHTLSGNTTYLITNAVSDQAHSFTLIITQTETVRTITFPASVKWQGGEIPDVSTANKTYILTFMTIDGGTTWLGMYGGEFGVS